MLIKKNRGIDEKPILLFLYRDAKCATTIVGKIMDGIKEIPMWV